VKLRIYLLNALILVAGISNTMLAQGHGALEDAPLDDPHAMHRQQTAVARASGAADVEVPDGLGLVDRFGERVDLRGDVIGNRIAVVNFVYTSCTTVCPVTSSIFSMLQTRLESELGREVALITITVDPARDTPHRMRSYAKNFAPRDGWSWLTGDKGSVDAALRAFGAYTPSFEDHPAMVLVGDARTGQWVRLYGFPSPEAIETHVRELLKARAS